MAVRKMILGAAAVAMMAGGGVAAPPVPAHPPADAAAIAAPTSALGLPCGLSVTADAMPGALVALDVMDPCTPNARVTITHGALSFVALTDAMGLLTLDIPALETPAFFATRLDDGRQAVALAGVPDLIDHDRAAIVWDEDRALQLHALQGGARHGEAGHIWQDNPGTVSDAMIGASGFLTMLGDATARAPRLAQVYSRPRALRDPVALSVEVPITRANCGQAVRAQSLQTGPDGRVGTQSLSLTIPDCDTVGEFLLLQNLFLAPNVTTN